MKARRGPRRYRQQTCRRPPRSRRQHRKTECRAGPRAADRSRIFPRPSCRPARWNAVRALPPAAHRAARHPNDGTGQSRSSNLLAIARNLPQSIVRGNMTPRSMGLADHGINHVDPLKAARVFTKLYAADKPRKFSPFTFRAWATEYEGEPNEHR